MNKINWKGVTVDTVTRTIALVIALLNQVFAIFGKGTIDIADDQVYQLVSIVFTIGAALAAWWKNNSFTRAAQIADEAIYEAKHMKEGE